MTNEMIAAQERLRLVVQEIFRLEREVEEQKTVEKDCDATRNRLDSQLRNPHSGYTYSQCMEQLVECGNRQKVALEKQLNLGSRLQQLREEHRQLISRTEPSSIATGRQPTSVSKIANLYGEKERKAIMHDVFISHATEDKESFVNAFVDELKKRGVNVWVDALSIKWGDSLRKAIDEGLKESRFGVVVISRHFISKGWTQYELDGLFEKEMSRGKVILPIWHNITKEEIQDFSPSLAGRKALKTSDMTPAEIAEELVTLLAGETGQGNKQEIPHGQSDISAK